MYEPQEDSIMLTDALKEYLSKNKANICLDMGTGTGIQGLTMSAYCKKVICCDINKDSVTYVYDLVKSDSKFKVIESDLFSNLQNYNEKFDVIAFNPPYLPREKEEKEDIELTSGESGLNVIIRFIFESKKYLNEKGKLFFVVSSLTDVNFLNKHLEKQGFKFKVVKSSHFFFEELMVYEAWL